MNDEDINTAISLAFIIAAFLACAASIATVLEWVI